MMEKGIAKSAESAQRERMSETAEHADKNVEIWKVKKLIKSLELARGNGTSMISLIIPPGQ